MSLYIVRVLDSKAFNPFRIIEKVKTIDGVRDRITNEAFPTLEEAQAFVDSEIGKGDNITLEETSP